jgi:hypothetical protein
MKMKLYDIVSEEVKESALEASRSQKTDKTISCWGCEDTLEHWVAERVIDTDGDGTEIEIIFKHNGKFYRTYMIRYIMAGFSEWGEKLGNNLDYKIDVEEVEKREMVVVQWEPVK